MLIFHTIKWPFNSRRQTNWAFPFLLSRTSGKMRSNSIFGSFEKFRDDKISDCSFQMFRAFCFVSVFPGRNHSHSRHFEPSKSTTNHTKLCAHAHTLRRTAASERLDFYLSKLLKFQIFHTFMHAHSDGISLHRNTENCLLLSKYSLLEPSPFSNEYSDWNSNVHNGASDQVASDVVRGA